MNTCDIIFTTINACLTSISVYCAIRSVKQTEKQTELMHKQTEIAQQQLEESQAPDYPTTMRLESIAHSIQSLNNTLKELRRQ